MTLLGICSGYGKPKYQWQKVMNANDADDEQELQPLYLCYLIQPSQQLQLGSIINLFLHMRKLSRDVNILLCATQPVSGRAGFNPGCAERLPLLFAAYFCAAATLFSLLQLLNKSVFMTSY